MYWSTDTVTIHEINTETKHVNHNFGTDKFQIDLIIILMIDNIIHGFEAKHKNKFSCINAMSLIIVQL